MPSNRASLVLTDTYRLRVSALRARAAQVVRGGWGDVSLDDLDETHARWAAAAAVRLRALQTTGVRLSAAYAAGFLTLELRERVTPGAPDASTVGFSRAGKPLEDALLPVLFTVKRALGDGQPAAAAMKLGLDRAVRNAGEDVAHAARSALDEAIAGDDRIVGWRRVTGGGCGACLAAATGAIQADDEVLDVHPACQCSKEPVVAGARESVLRPTGREMFDAMPAAAQDALFAGSGGAEKADLIRSGRVPFDALVQRDPMVVLPDAITERPLSALT